MADIEEPLLYDAIGGADGVEDIVAGLYQRTMADERLAPFFEGHAMDVIVAHQHELIAAALGGPETYTGRSLREAHADLAIQPGDFEALVGHLGESMAACGVAPSVSERAVAIIARLWYAQQWSDADDTDADAVDRERDA